MKKNSPKSDRAKRIENRALRATNWIGSSKSLVLHTILFVVAFILPFFGISLDRVLLILTTAVSLEAIYLAIFIQMSVNKNTEDIEEIQDDIEDIEEGIEEIQEDVDEISEDIDEIQKDVDEIQEDIEDIEEEVKDISEEIDEDQVEDKKRDEEIFAKVEATLAQLMKEIEGLKKR